MGERTSIGSTGGFAPGGRSSVSSDHGFKPAANNRTSTGSNHGFSSSAQPPEVDTFGGSNLEAKQKFVDTYYDSSFTMENVEDLGSTIGKFFRQDIPSGTKKAFNSITEALTPGFVRRFRNKKIYTEEVEDRDQ